MEPKGIRMKAYAVNFSEIRVFLSKDYYSGISNKFYLKDLKTDELTLLMGDKLNSDHDPLFQEYALHTTFKMGKVYKIMDAYGLTCDLDYSKLAFCEEFDDLYYYDGDDLGATYSKESTTFKVWAPLATDSILKLIDTKTNTVTFHPMKRTKKGVYYVTVEGDLEKLHYYYMIKHEHAYDITLDPYGYSSSSNGRSNIIVDINKIKLEKYNLPVLEKRTDAIIYETSVRDFSVSSTGGMVNRGKFLAFTETETSTDSGYPTGLDYLTSLGITHLQLMPINDFATVDEHNVSELYNWGYDPAQYNVTEGSYVTDPDDGYKRISEAVAMVNALHSRGIRVILDVVYNHMHDVNINALERTCPNYYFRRYSDGKLSNGSWCGNDLNTTAKMCRKYILDMCKRWQVLYGVDGFRFDLMGIIDIDTMKQVVAQGKELDPSFMVYGEGWNMGTALPEDKRTMMSNHAQVPEISFFNDFFRDTMRGTNKMESKGYFSGDTYKTFEAIKAMCDLEKFTKVSQSINYVECHDNATCYDKLRRSNYDEDKPTRKKRLRQMLTAVILSQGIPFIHSGQEFYRTKNGQPNTYNAGDLVNALDWSRRDLEIKNVEYVKFLIQLRKNNPCFRYNTAKQIKANISLANIEHRMIEYKLHQENGDYKDFIVYLNASLNTIEVKVEEGYKVLYHSDKGKIEDNALKVEGAGIAILVRE